MQAEFAGCRYSRGRMFESFRAAKLHTTLNLCDEVRSGLATEPGSCWHAGLMQPTSPNL